MEKINGKSFDVLEKNIKNMKKLFPEVFIDGKIDVDRLKNTLGDYVENEDERYNFTWNGKNDAIKISQKQTKGTLRPNHETSKKWGSTENMYIEGDNLETLKVLQKSYHGKIKMIYIDPPYNTGKDFVYKDNYKDNTQNYLKYTGQLDNDGKKNTTNIETSGRYHTDWLNMMYPRLRLARKLLTEDGVIFISIDDNEVHNLRKICDEIFGEDNFLGDIIWNSTKSVTNTALISVAHTHNLVYFKSMDYYVKNRNLFRLPEDGEGFENPDNDPRGPWKADPFQVGGWRPNQQYEIINPNTGVKYKPNPNSSWKNDYKRFKELIKDNRIVFGKTGNAGPQRKRFKSEAQERGRVAKTIWDDVETTTNGTQLLKEMFDNVTVFNNPKPVGFIKRILELSTNKDENDIVLDFFAGSSTTAHAVMDLNAEDGGNRKYIMVQLPEKTDENSEAYKSGYKTISEIGRERIRRAGDKIKEDYKDKEWIEDLDIGFKSFKLDSSNIKEWNPQYKDKDLDFESLVDNFVEDRSQEDVLYEIILKYGLNLTTDVEEYSIDGKNIYNLDSGKLYICLDDEINENIVDKIVDLNKKNQADSTRVVFKDIGFKDDETKLNAKLTLENNGIEEVLSI